MVCWATFEEDTVAILSFVSGKLAFPLLQLTILFIRQQKGKVFSQDVVAEMIIQHVWQDLTHVGISPELGPILLISQLTLFVAL